MGSKSDSLTRVLTGFPKKERLSNSTSFELNRLMDVTYGDTQKWIKDVESVDVKTANVNRESASKSLLNCGIAIHTHAHCRDDQGSIREVHDAEESR